MAKHEVIIHENTGATKESAPYLGSYIAKETIKEDSFASSACAKAGMSPIQFRAIIDGSFQAIEELERQGLVRIHTDLGVICAHIPGSFPTADAAPDPEKNKLCLCLRLADEIRLSLADTVPVIVADDSLTKLRVDNVMDLETPRPYNLIHGKHVFRVAGYNMVLDDVGATVYLTDKNGVTYEVVVDEVISKQLFKGHTAALLPAGDYKLVVKSRAGDAEGPLQTAFRRIKYLEVVDPTPGEITDVRSVDLDTPDLMSAGGTNVATGEGLADAAKVKLELLSEDAEQLIKTYDLEVDEATDTSVTFETVAEDPGTAFQQDGKVLVTLYRSDGTTVVASRKVRMHIPGR